MKLEPLVPPAWAMGPHAQTILGHLLPSPRLRDKGKRFAITVSSGDQLIGYATEGTSNTVVSIFHGLAGSVDSTYMHRTAIEMQKLGHTVLLVNHRGCGEGAGLAREPYHSGRGEDLSEALAFARRTYPRHRHLAIGFSMSANALLCLLSGMRGSVLPDAAVALNAPIDLHACSKLLGQGLNRIYDTKFYFQCVRDVKLNKADEELKRRLPFYTKLYNFDQLYTAPAAGFRDRDDYYTTCSTKDQLARITTPTVIITAKDDPFVPFESYARAKLSNSVLLHAEEFGGHMGYLTQGKTPLGTRRWQDYAVVEAVRSLS